MAAKLVKPRLFLNSYANSFSLKIVQKSSIQIVHYLNGHAHQSKSGHLNYSDPHWIVYYIKTAQKSYQSFKHTD